MSDEDRGVIDIGVVCVLGLALVVLRLAHVVDWSWWWVTAPFWGIVGLWSAVVLTALVAAAIAVGVRATGSLAKEIALAEPERLERR